MEIEVYMNPLAMVDIILIFLVVYVVIPMAHQVVVMLVPQMILIEVVHIVPLPLNLEGVSIFKLENTAAVTKWDPKELALGKAQGTAAKYLKLLPVDVS